MSDRLVSHQVVRLSAGRHSSPEDGACVMELASMLAGEPFGDHPRAVDPCLGAFLRTYNDGIDEERRQDLYALAAAVVDTRSRRFARRRRSEMRRELRSLNRWPAGWSDQAGIRLATCYLSLGEVGHRRALDFVRGLTDPPTLTRKGSSAGEPARHLARARW